MSTFGANFDATADLIAVTSFTLACAFVLSSKSKTPPYPPYNPYKYIIYIVAATIVLYDIYQYVSYLLWKNTVTERGIVKIIHDNSVLVWVFVGALWKGIDSYFI
jgi:hypothetical protein